MRVEPSQLKPLAFASVAISLWAVLRQYLGGSAMILLFTAVMLMWAYLRVGRPIRLPRTLAFLATVFGISLLGMGIYWVRLPAGEALAYFLIGSILAKSFALQRLTDFSELMLLSVLAMIAAGAFNSSDEYAVALVGYLACAGFCVYNVHLVGEWLAHRQYRPVGSETAVLAGQPRRAVSGYATVAVPTCLLALVAFVLVPRHAPAWQMLGGSARGTRSHTGFSDTLVLGEMVHILEDPTPVLRVKMLHEGERTSYTPALYLRGVARSEYVCRGDRWQWLRDRGDEGAVGLEATTLDGLIPIQKPIEPLSKQVYWQFFYEEEIATNLFVIDRPTAVACDRSQHLTFHAETNTLWAAERPPKRFQYILQTERPTRPYVGPLPRPTTKPARRESVAQVQGLPPGPHVRPIEPTVARVDLAKYRELATGILRDQPRALAPIEQVRKLETYLRTQFEYTLDQTDVDAQAEPVMDFLTRRRRGHCEYFASALTLLCRSLAMPARVVTGFKGGQFNTFGDYYLVRNRDAHAWTEVYFTDAGWLRFDPTPPVRDSVAEPEETGMVKLFWDMVDVLRFSWLTRVTHYSESERRQFVESLHKQLLGQQGDSDSSWAITRTAKRLLDLILGQEYEASWQQVLHWMVVVLIVLLVTFVLKILMIASRGTVRQLRARWRNRRLLRYGNAWDCPVEFYRRALLALANRGITKPTAKTAREFVTDLRRHASTIHPEMAVLTEAYLRIRFGEQKLAPPDSKRTSAALESMQVKLAGHEKGDGSLFRSPS